MKNAKEYLLSKGIHPSHQRVAIMDYLLKNPIHPTVETIYNALSTALPTLSKTTIYNTLKLFEENNAVLSLNIEDKQMRYDGCVTPHAHLICEQCGDVFDIGISRTPIFSETDCQNFTINDTKIYLKGICPSCKNKIKIDASTP